MRKDLQIAQRFAMHYLTDKQMIHVVDDCSRSKDLCLLYFYSADKQVVVARVC